MTTSSSTSIAPVPPLVVNMRGVRNTLFLTAVLLMNFTLLRPSPVDIMFMSALAISIFINQRITVNFFAYFFLLGAWALSYYVASIGLIDNPKVTFEMLVQGFVIVLSLGACYIAMSWRERDFHRFFKVYIFAACLAAGLGITGFVLGIDTFLWDGRAKGLFDDPNMYGGFLIPGVLACIYFLRRGGGRIVVFGAMMLLIAGLLFSFSRAAIGSFAVCGTLYMIFLYRNDLPRALLYFVVLICVAALLLAIASFAVDDFQTKLMDRLTVAKSYDLGHFGRYNRYLLAVPMILDNPLGIGLFQIEKYFPEPIHNFVISSFLNYGWLAGSVWLLLMVLPIRLAYLNFKASRHPLAVLVYMCFLGEMFCSLLHETEHWRHLWLYMGLAWGFNVHNFPAAGAQGIGHDGLDTEAA